uniref:Uncharacterized protein n=1 Tax=Romanomermis culicivorax TaxID=13658 RepID=A0A915I960_ROMCU
MSSYILCVYKGCFRWTVRCCYIMRYAFSRYGDDHAWGTAAAREGPIKELDITRYNVKNPIPVCLKGSLDVPPPGLDANEATTQHQLDLQPSIIVIRFAVLYARAPFVPAVAKP